MYFKELCAEQNYPSLYEGALECKLLLMMAHAYLHESQQYTVCHPCKDTNPFELFGFMFYKMLKPEKTTISFDFHTARGVLRIKTHQNKKMGFLTD
jgi:hypothetical protein